MSQGNYRLEGKVALVTGAGRGIGRAIALRLAREGADVVINDIDASLASAVAGEVKALGRRSAGIAADVSQRQPVVQLVERAITEMGRIDLLVNNAGIGPAKPLLSIPEEEWDRVMRINVKAAFLMTQEVGRQMVKQGSGKIINIASIAGKQGVSYMAHYSASKFAVIGLTQSAARELARFGILVNAIAPGVADTAMWEKLEQELSDIVTKSSGHTYDTSKVRKRWTAPVLLGRFALPEDIANVAAFLASSDADYMTGQTIVVDGGTIFS